MNKIAAAIFVGLFLSLAAVPTAYAAWAVAFGDNGDPIVNRGSFTEGEAKARALEDCATLFKNCKVVISGSSGCAALANGGERKWGAARDHNKPRARDEALEACDAAGGRRCKVVHEFCGY